jgi:hypothetical protein
MPRKFMKVRWHFFVRWEITVYVVRVHVQSESLKVKASHRKVYHGKIINSEGGNGKRDVMFVSDNGKEKKIIANFGCLIRERNVIF